MEPSLNIDMRQSKLLLVDDELQMVKILQEFLEESGFEVGYSTSGKEALVAVGRHKHDLVLLDIQMPDMDGIEVCRKIRKMSPKLPVIFVTAADSDIDKIRGLNIGADDYISKPFNELEVVARINAVLRRTLSSRSQAIQKFGELQIDPVKREVTNKGISIKFTPKEFDLLYYLMDNRGEAISRERLLEDVWKMEGDIPTRTIDLHILQLRKKLEKNPSEPDLIITVHGFGYKFEG